MRITESRLKRIIREELLGEGDVVPVDFRSKAVRARFTPGISDPFIFSGSAGQIARVLEMYRDQGSDGGGRVVYEQYIEDKDEPGTWVQDPAQPLEKSLLGFMSRYGPFKGTIEHLRKVEDEEAEDEAHMERVMSDEGFPDYKNYSKYPREVMKSREYMDAFRKAMSTMPSVARSLSRPELDEARRKFPPPGNLWKNIRKRQAAGKRPRKPGEKGYPKALDFK